MVYFCCYVIFAQRGKLSRFENNNIKGSLRIPFRSCKLTASEDRLNDNGLCACKTNCLCFNWLDVRFVVLFRFSTPYCRTLKACSKRNYVSQSFATCFGQWRPPSGRDITTIWKGNLYFVHFLFFSGITELTTALNVISMCVCVCVCVCVQFLF